MARPKKSKKRTVSPLDAVVNKLLISLDDELVSDDNISSKTEEYKSIINRELEISKGISNGNIIEFNRAINDNHKKNDQTTNIELDDDLGEYLAKNAGNIFQYYNERYRNRFIEAQDLAFIAKFIPSLGQVINVYTTHILSSDDLSGTVKRNIALGSSLDESEKAQVIKSIETFEDENKLLYKIKSTVNETLKLGYYFVYAPSYQKLFTEYAKNIEKKKRNGGSTTAQMNDPEMHGNTTMESVSISGLEQEFGPLVTTCALESAEVKDLIKALPNNTFDKKDLFNKMDSAKMFAENVATVECVDSSIPFDVMEAMPDLASNLGLTEDLRHIFEDKCMPATEANGNGASDGTYDPTGNKNAALKSANKKHANTFNVTGTYMKFMDPKNIIKIKILDEVVGYFYVDSRKQTKSKANVTFSNAEWTNISKQSTIEKVANMLANKVAKQFSSKFVSQHIEFKKLIADCIMANGVVNTQYRIQFIPKEDLFEFKIRENSNGDGVSILSEALWPAKILASIRIRKTLNYINKSGDKMIAKINRGSADTSGRNQAQRVLRNLQESNITFGDIIGDSSLMFHKYAADGNIQMPVSRSGKQFVEFEKMEGQTVEMSTEYEKELENQAILATGCPPLLIEQANQADFSRAFTTAHVGFAGIVAGLQADIEEVLTAFYRRIVENLDIDDDIKTKASNTLKIKLPRPRALSISSGNEIVENAARFAEQFTNLRYGEPNEEKGLSAEILQQIKYAIVKENSPFIDWTKIEEMADDVYMREMKVKAESGGDSTAGSDDDM